VSEVDGTADAAGGGKGKEGDEGGKKKPKKKTKVAVKKVKKKKGDVYIPPEDRKRTWELVFQIRNFENVTNTKLKFFFAISVVSFSKKRLPRLKFRPIYTPCYVPRGHGS